MAGLDPATHAVDARQAKGAGELRLMGEAWVYVMTNRPNGTLYVGVATDLVRRVWQHREGVLDGFIATYGLTGLVWFEEHAEIVVAIQREKAMKHWRRAWKVRLILEANSARADLYPALLG